MEVVGLDGFRQAASWRRLAAEARMDAELFERVADKYERRSRRLAASADEHPEAGNCGHAASASGKFRQAKRPCSCLAIASYARAASVSERKPPM